jgi:CRISPR-associated protein Csm3
MPQDEAKRIHPLRGKVLVEGVLVVKTGLHVGSQAAKMEIGSIDSPVIRDPLTRRPYIPGSSLKGKLRALVERSFQDPPIEFNRSGGSSIYRHECSDPLCPSCRLFGSTGLTNADRNLPGRLAVRDLFLREESAQELERLETGLLYTEWKFENALDRLTAAANPRQIERVPADSRFDFQLVYTLEAAPQIAAEDLNRIFLGLRLLEDDALGGHGSRGYGRVVFTDVKMRRRDIAYYLGDAPEEVREVGTPDRLSTDICNWAAA